MAGLAYAIAAIAIAPGTIDRFRAATGGSGGADVDGMVTVVWIVAAVGAVLAVILFALYIVLALGLRRGSNAARIAAWVVSGLGLLVGCASTVVMTVQLSGADAAQGTPEAALADAYPGSWFGLNVVLCVAQMAGYVVVGMLLLAAPGTFFGRAPKPLPPDPFASPALAGYPRVPLATARSPRVATRRRPPGATDRRTRRRRPPRGSRSSRAGARSRAPTMNTGRVRPTDGRHASTNVRHPNG
nr:hypothetical protein GCM10020092_000860 [Actinoplanes digitatis]